MSQRPGAKKAQFNQVGSLSPRPPRDNPGGAGTKNLKVSAATSAAWFASAMLRRHLSARGAHRRYLSDV